MQCDKYNIALLYWYNQLEKIHQLKYVKTKKA